jgi:hypothetical protein
MNHATDIQLARTPVPRGHGSTASTSDEGGIAECSKMKADDWYQSQEWHSPDRRGGRPLGMKRERNAQGRNLGWAPCRKVQGSASRPRNSARTRLEVCISSRGYAGELAWRWAIPMLEVITEEPIEVLILSALGCCFQGKKVVG